MATSIRWPADVLAGMKSLAREHGRSLHSEVIQACKAWIAKEKPVSKLSYNQEKDRYEGQASDGKLLVVSPEVYQEYHRTVGHTNSVLLGEEISKVSWWEPLVGKMHWSDVRIEE